MSAGRRHTPCLLQRKVPVSTGDRWQSICRLWGAFSAQTGKIVAEDGQAVSVVQQTVETEELADVMQGDRLVTVGGIGAGGSANKFSIDAIRPDPANKGAMFLDVTGRDSKRVRADNVSLTLHPTSDVFLADNIGPVWKDFARGVSFATNTAAFPSWLAHGGPNQMPAMEFPARSGLTSASDELERIPFVEGSLCVLMKGIAPTSNPAMPVITATGSTARLAVSLTSDSRIRAVLSSNVTHADFTAAAVLRPAQWYLVTIRWESSSIDVRINGASDFDTIAIPLDSEERVSTLSLGDADEEMSPDAHAKLWIGYLIWRNRWREMASVEQQIAAHWGISL